MLKNHALRILEESLDYDVGFGDLTTELMIPKNQESEAVFIAKEESIICGIDFVIEFMEKNGLSVITSYSIHYTKLYENFRTKTKIQRRSRKKRNCTCWN